MLSLATGWMTPQQYSSMSMTGEYLLACLASERGIVLRGTFVNPTLMMWYRACLEMLHGVRLLISWVDCRGVVVGRFVGYSSRASSSLTIGSWWCTAGWVLWLALLDGVGRRSWMKVGGPVGAAVGILVGMVNGISGWIVSWRFVWLASWSFGGVTGRLIGCRLGSELRGLQLLATTVISLSSSLSARIWNGLLLHVCPWWINGSCCMVLGDVMLFDVVATLGGGLSANLGAVPSTRCAGWFARMLVSCCMALTCFAFAVADVGIVPPSAVRRSVATRMERSCCNAIGIWQWVG